MSWKQISECLPAELTARMELEKAGAAKAPASVTGQRPTKGETVENGAANSGQENRAPLRTSRWEYTATKAGAPLSEAVYCHLRVIEGGRTEPGGNAPVLPFAQTSLRTRRANWLKLVVG